MNAVEIEEQVSLLAAAPFDAAEFPFAFLEAFGEKETTVKRLRSTNTGSTNKSDIGGVLQRNNIHLKVAAPGQVPRVLAELRDSPQTTKQKAKFILATDGQWIEAENLVEGETLVCAYAQLADRFAFFLALAGISTVKAIRENAFDIKATARLNKLYVTLLKDNPDWATAERREDLNHFFARLIFCFFAEDTNIIADGVFTQQFERMSAADAANSHEVLAAFFRAMATPHKARDAAGVPNWAKPFPYVNGGLFAGDFEVPRFTKVARSYLIHIGHLDWRAINPDIFGSMIQAVADDDERASLGMHYTSVPNILKVLNPLFLDDLRQNLEAAGEGQDQGSKRKLLNLRRRLARIRVFDPACGSGNFLVIAYKEMRRIEAEINRRRGEADLPTVIPLTNFRGIELRHFAAEIARLALVIAKFQADVLHRGENLALSEFLPLQSDNWIVCGNALRLDWATVCPPFGKTSSSTPTELFEEIEETAVAFENEGGEVYVCGNPPYRGSTWQTKEQKADMQHVFSKTTKSWKSLDYIAGWFRKAVDYGAKSDCVAAFVSTNSICQGQQVAILWPGIFEAGYEIVFGHQSFKWANLASDKAGVTVVIVGLTAKPGATRTLYAVDENGELVVKEANYINGYLIDGAAVIVDKRSKPCCGQAEMTKGNQATDGGHLLLTREEVAALDLTKEQERKFIRRIYGSAEFIKGLTRYCLWIEDADLEEAMSVLGVRRRVEAVRQMRSVSSKLATQDKANTPHRFDEMRQNGSEKIIAAAAISSENREFLPATLYDVGAIVSNKLYALYDAPLYNLALIASTLHLTWIATVCVRMRTDYSYSNTLGWNTFPVPTLTTQNKADLTSCAEEILLARERYFPATIADMYDPRRMDREFPEVRRAHERNDEVLERIYIGRRFRNDTERLEVLFRMYEEMVG